LPLFEIQALSEQTLCRQKLIHRLHSSRW